MRNKEKKLKCHKSFILFTSARRCKYHTATKKSHLLLDCGEHFSNVVVGAVISQILGHKASFSQLYQLFNKSCSLTL